MKRDEFLDNAPTVEEWLCALERLLIVMDDYDSGAFDEYDRMLSEYYRTK